jgi:hypothetical protein
MVVVFVLYLELASRFMTRATVLGRASLAKKKHTQTAILLSIYIHIMEGTGQGIVVALSFPHTFQEAPAMVSYPVKDIFLSSPELT